MKKVIKYAVMTILISAILLLSWFIINNLGSLKSKLLIMLMIGVGILVKIFYPKLTKIFGHRIVKIIKHRHFSAIFIFSILLLAIILRFGFYFAYSYMPFSDPATFLGQAQSIASGSGLFHNTYVAFFPYLAAYSNLLGVAIKIISNPWLAIIILNTIFDIAAAFIAMILVKKISPAGSKKPLVALTLWLLNPFNIIFSVMSLPIIVVNFFIILTIFLAYILSRKILSNKITPILIFSILLGLAIGYGNCYRPIFIVALIAILIFLAYLVLTNKRTSKILILAAISSIIIIVTYFGVQSLNVAFVSNQTGLNVSTNAGGWSVFVGANNKSNGSWNVEDDTYLHNILKYDRVSSYDQIQTRLTKEGADRYKSYGLVGSISLMIKKLSVFAGGQISVSDIEASVIGYEGSATAMIFSLYILVYIFIIFIAGARYVYLSLKDATSGAEIKPIIIFVILLALGFFFSDMFVESKERYAQIMYPLFIILAAISTKSNQ